MFCCRVGEFRVGRRRHSCRRCFSSPVCPPFVHLLLCSAVVDVLDFSRVCLLTCLPVCLFVFIRSSSCVFHRLIHASDKEPRVGYQTCCWMMLLCRSVGSSFTVFSLPSSLSCFSSVSSSSYTIICLPTDCRPHYHHPVIIFLIYSHSPSRSPLPSFVFIL